MVYYSDDRLDLVFAGLADPTRREILARLATGEKTISDLASRFEMSLPAVSKHVRVLERAGLARVRRQGRSRHTTLVAAPLREARDWIERYRAFWEFQFDQLEAYLESEGAEDPPVERSEDAGPPRPDIRATAATEPQEESEWPREEQGQGRRSKSGGRSARRGSGSSTRGRGPKS